MAVEFKKITLQEIIDITNQFNNGEVSEQEMSEFGTKMSLRSYLTLREKVSLVKTMQTYYIQGIKGGLIKDSIQFYIEEFFSVLLGQYALIDCSNRKLINEENYDLLYPVFAPFILNYCQSDYNIYKEMLNTAITAQNAYNLISALDSIDENTIKTATEDNRKLIEELTHNQELIKQLGKIAVLNDPKTAEIIEDFKEKAIKAN